VSVFIEVMTTLNQLPSEITGEPQIIGPYIYMFTRTALHKLALAFYHVWAEAWY
jgi:hypothetical protein